MHNQSIAIEYENGILKKIHFKYALGRTKDGNYMRSVGLGYIILLK